MTSTNYTISSGSNKMIMKSGCDTGYFIGTGSEIFKSGCSTRMSVDYAGKILKNGSDTGYVICGSSIMKDTDNGHNIDWMFN